MKVLVTILIMSLGMSRGTRSQESVLKIIEGVLFGFSADSRLEEIQSCLENLDHADRDFYIAYEDIKHQTPLSVEMGLKSLAKAVQVVPLAVDWCQNSPSDFARFKKAIGSLKQPSYFEFTYKKDLVLNGVSIYREIFKALEDYENSKFYEFGFNVGEVLGKI